MAKPEGRLLPVRVTPRAGRNEVVGWQGPALNVRVTAAPEGGEANRVVSRLLALTFGVPPSAVLLVRGARSREKLFRVGECSLDELRARLDRARV
jgi:uncharacterized protein